MSAPPCLLLIDIQTGFKDPYWGPRNNLGAEQTIAAVLKFWRERSWPLIHVQHLSTEPRSPLRPGTAGVEFMDFAKPRDEEPIVQKCVNSAFVGTDLEARLRAAHHSHLVLIGLTSDHCVSTTARMAANLGFAVTILADATATFDRFDMNGVRYPAEEVHRISLASLHREFANVTDTQTLLASLGDII